MTREHLLTFHAQSYCDYLAWWQSPDRRAALEMTAEEAAFFALNHAGLYSRHLGDSHVPAELEHLPLQDRACLVGDACDFARCLSLPSHFARILKTDLLEPEEIEEVERMLSWIDDVDAVGEMAVRLVDPSQEKDANFLEKLIRPKCIVANLVRQLSIRPDLVAVASRALLVRREPRYLDDGQPADWFTHLRELDRELNSPGLEDLLDHRADATSLASSLALQPSSDASPQAAHAAENR